MEPDVGAAIQDALGVLKQAGATLVDVRFPPLDPVVGAHRAIIFSEASAAHEEHDPHPRRRALRRGPAALAIRPLPHGDAVPGRPASPQARRSPPIGRCGGRSTCWSRRRARSPRRSIGATTARFGGQGSPTGPGLPRLDAPVQPDRAAGDLGTVRVHPGRVADRPPARRTAVRRGHVFRAAAATRRPPIGIPARRRTWATAVTVDADEPTRSAVSPLVRDDAADRCASCPGLLQTTRRSGLLSTPLFYFYRNRHVTPRSLRFSGCTRRSSAGRGVGLSLDSSKAGPIGSARSSVGLALWCGVRPTRQRAPRTPFQGGGTKMARRSSEQPTDGDEILKILWEIGPAGWAGSNARFRSGARWQ